MPRHFAASSPAANKLPDALDAPQRVELPITEILPDRGQSVQHHVTPARGPEKCAFEHLPAGVPVETRVVIGAVALTICDTARKEDADLIVMASHGHTGFKRLMIGSVAERTVQHAPCPVLVVRSRKA